MRSEKKQGVQTTQGLVEPRKDFGFDSVSDGNLWRILKKEVI